MKTKNEIITELDALLRKGGVEKTEFETLSSDINNLSAAEKEEVLLDFIKKVYSMEDLINFYNRHPEKLNDQISAAMNDFKDTTGYSDSEIKELFDKAGLTEENVKVEVEKALDLDLLEAKNAADQEGISLEEWLERDIERLETEKNEELAEIDRQIDELEKNLDHSNFEDLDITEITNQIEQLSQERVKIQEEKGNNLTSEDIAKIQELSQKLETLNTLKEQRKKLAHKYDTLIAKRKKQLEKLKKEKENQNKNGKKKGNRKDLVYKTLAGGVGFVVGVGLSCEPGIGQVRMMISSAKLIQAGVNKGVKVWSKKHPEGKIAKISSKLSDKAHKFGENHPRIASAYNKTKKFIGNDKVQWFINGVAAGYVAGNIYEKLTGQTVSEALFSNNDTKDVTNVANVPTQPNTPSNTPDVPSNTPADINLTPGQSYDLSGLSQGLVSSDSHDYVNLLTEYGKDAVVDKFHTLPNGEIMVHFSSGGEGYAWLPLDEVKEYLAKGAEVVENVSRSL